MELVTPTVKKINRIIIASVAKKDWEKMSVSGQSYYIEGLKNIAGTSVLQEYESNGFIYLKVSMIDWQLQYPESFGKKNLSPTSTT